MRRLVRLCLVFAAISSSCNRPPESPTLAYYNISGTVPGTSGAAVTVALSGAKSASTTTDASGKYVFDGLTSGDYVVTPSLAGYAFSPSSVAVTLDGEDAAGKDFAATDPWVQVDAGTASHLTGLWGSSATDVWVVGRDATLLHWNGIAWTGVANSSTSGFYGAWGSRANDVWAVGTSGTILHWTGYWSTVESGTAAQLDDVWGSGANDVWAVGLDGIILHWNGGSWSSVPSGTSARLKGIWGSGATDAWAVGGAGTILHWDGSAWSSFTSGTTIDLYRVWGSAAGDVWVTGLLGTVLHHQQ
jgi:hypothetical protein